jgi:hypothetical protein
VSTMVELEKDNGLLCLDWIRCACGGVTGVNTPTVNVPAIRIQENAMAWKIMVGVYEMVMMMTTCFDFYFDS